MALHPALEQSRRIALQLPGVIPSEQIQLGEYVMLATCGFASAVAVLLIEFDLRIPGHAILRAVFPMAFGLACVPRRGAGTVMGVFAAGTWGMLFLMSRSAGLPMKGLGATTSLLFTGPLLDAALWRAREGWRIYAAFVIAGLFSNLLAMGVQLAAKLSGVQMGGGRTVSAWLAVSAITYPACGAAAGWISALVWFRWRRRDRETGLEFRRNSATGRSSATEKGR